MGGKRKIDPATGKFIKNPSDTNRVKRPKKKLRTAAEKAARSEDAGDIARNKRRHTKVSVSRLMFRILMMLFTGLQGASSHRSGDGQQNFRQDYLYDEQEQGRGKTPCTRVQGIHRRYSG